VISGIVKPKPAAGESADDIRVLVVTLISSFFAFESDSEPEGGFFGRCSNPLLEPFEQSLLLWLPECFLGVQLFGVSQKLQTGPDILLEVLVLDPFAPTVLPF
jgi:hypothetical protein